MPLTAVSESSCPLCGSTSTSPAPGALDDESRPVYVKILERQMSGRWRDVAARMATVECENCGLLIRMPYPSRADRARLHLDGAPVHKMGWQNLKNALLDPPRGGYCAPLDLWEVVVKRIGAPTRFAEFGCPFQGYIVSRAATSASRHMLRRRLVGSWRQPYLDRAGGRSAFLHAVANRLEPLRVGRKRDGLLSESDVGRGSLATYVVVDSTLTRWSLGCVQYGNACWQLAAQIEDVVVLGMEDLRQDLRGERLSLLGFFDTLDHTDDLAATMRWATDVSDAILIVNHHPSEAARQHRFGLTVRAIEYIARSQDGWGCEDLSQDVPATLREHHLTYLLTRRRP